MLSSFAAAFIRNLVLRVSADIPTASSTLAAIIVAHTLEESWQVPSYEAKLLQAKRSIHSTREILLDSLPIFAVLPLASYLTYHNGWFSWIRDTLTVVAVLHPVLDHVVLTIQHHVQRPGTRTALLVVLPLGIWNVYSSLQLKRPNEMSITGGVLGVAISIGLYVPAVTEIMELQTKHAQRRRMM